MKKLIVLLFLCLLSASVGKGIYYLKDGFSVRRLQILNNEVAENWNPEVDQVLKQFFRYIGRGRQCFAFESADGKYVLKFPRTDIYTIPLWARALPLHSYRNRLKSAQRERQNFVFTSFQLSFSDLQSQTGLIALHLGQSKSTGKKLTVIDKLGCKHNLPLEKTCFALQHKRPILMKAFSAAREKGDRKEAEHILDALVAVISERAQKGILNQDRSFLRNFGFDGEKAYQIDVGSFFRNPGLTPKAAYEKSLRDSMDPVQEWLAEKDPEMLTYLNQKLSTIL